MFVIACRHLSTTGGRAAALLCILRIKGASDNRHYASGYERGTAGHGLIQVLASTAWLAVSCRASRRPCPPATYLPRVGGTSNFSPMPVAYGVRTKSVESHVFVLLPPK